ncbi:MAG: [FeFe] hydrogenase H-cluster radical SAM maturase HydE [Oscillospiraceae bacterium]|nr:[FeFe] hydrogenase H-cluster radical SAM maturase HydE [Oscillospiraceae bacterium]
MSRITELIDKLEREHILSKSELAEIISGRTPETDEYLFAKARAVRETIYGKDVYMRGLIEFTNYCKNDCLYCGIRRSAKGAERYRLAEEQILDCCETGYGLGFRTFVLQGGEDGFYTDDKIVSIVSRIKEKFPDCAVTLSIGEKSRESYEKFRNAGADRYLLRHETANSEHYGKLHPKELSLENRMRCLADLKELGFQTGCGFMVGSPYQTAENLAEDLLYIHDLQPHMVGIGPFVPHHDTPFAEEKQGSLETTLLLLGMIRLILPNVLLPATTALGTIHPKGREMGILAGANVVMPNLSPQDVRKKYLLYDNKICTGDEAAECIACLGRRMESIGYKLVSARGDFKE